MASAAYGIGAGAVAVLHGRAGESLGFRGVFALTAIPLVAVPVAGRLLTEPDRFLLGVLFGAAYGTPAIALTAELFPTSIRSAVAGWLVVAGVLGSTSGLWLAGTIAGALDSFGGAMAAVCLPAGLVAVLFARLPETRGLELEQSASEELRRRVGPV
jgi:MFS family permease